MMLDALELKVWLASCSHTANHNCGHSEDVIITCFAGSSYPRPYRQNGTSITNGDFMLSSVSYTDRGVKGLFYIREAG